MIKQKFQICLLITVFLAGGWAVAVSAEKVVPAPAMEKTTAWKGERPRPPPEMLRPLDLPPIRVMRPPCPRPENAGGCRH